MRYAAMAFVVIAVVGQWGIAQTFPPFIGAGATAFDPEISVVNSGVINDVQATVSHDRKYVTITAQPANTALLALQNFTFQRGTAIGTTTLGFVGSIGGGAVTGPGAGGAGGPVSSGISFAAGSILGREGMTRLGP